MVSNKIKDEPIFIGINNERIELVGKDKEELLAERLAKQEARAILETEYKAKQKAREDAIKKLAEVAGLTEAELNAIL